MKAKKLKLASRISQHNHILSQHKNITTFLLLISVNFCFGQGSIPNSRQNSFQLNIGINQLKEENLHPKVHAGMIYGLRYSNVRTNLHQRQFQIGIHFSQPKTKYENLASSMNIQIDACYSYLFYIVTKNKFTFSLGPELGLHYSLSHYPNWDESHLYWSDFLGLGVLNTLKYQLNNKQQLTLDFSIPVVSVISRPELDRMYKIDDISLGGIISSMHSNLEGAFWNKSFAIKSRLEYHFSISNHVTHAICYSFNYSRTRENEGLPFQNIQHLVGLKLCY
jgi:hypothetical protein